MNSKIQITRVHQLSSLLLSLTGYGGDVSVPLDHHDKGTSRVVWVSLSNQRRRKEGRKTRKTPFGPERQALLCLVPTCVRGAKLVKLPCFG